MTSLEMGDSKKMKKRNAAMKEQIETSGMTSISSNAEVAVWRKDR